MPATNPPVEVVRAFFGEAAAYAEPVAAGLSGASVWRMRCGDAVTALKRSDADRQDTKRGAWAARLLRRAAEGAAPFVAAPMPTCDGRDAIRSSDGAGWVLAPWRPGAPLTPDAPDDAQRVAAEALAAFHAAVAPGEAAVGESTAVAQRQDRLKRAAGARRTGGSRAPAELADAAAALRRRAAEAVDAVPRTLPLQPAQVDSRPEHFLLTDDVVTGLIDFDAMRRDTPAVDVARLAGELALGRPSAYADHVRRVVGWYNAVARTPVAPEAVAALDLSGAVLAAENWLEWLADPAAVGEAELAIAARLEALLARLRGLTVGG